MQTRQSSIKLHEPTHQNSIQINQKKALNDVYGTIIQQKWYFRWYSF